VAHDEIILAELSAAESGLAALQTGRQGIVRIAAFPSAARALIAPLWRRLADADASQAPSLRLSVVEPDEALDQLRKRSTDLALVHSYTVLPRDFPAACEQAVLMEEPVLLALHPAQADALHLTAGQPADLSLLADVPWLAPC
jgi:DNA-binding transcriptional LysR family regulator